MKNWGEIQESMKADIDQLKNQMGQMFEMMVVLKDAVTTWNEEAHSSHPSDFEQGTLQTRDPNHGNKANQEFPPYGLPPARNEEAHSSHPSVFQQGTLQTRDPNHGNKANQEFPPYGLPLNYDPPYEGYEGQETIPPVFNVASAKGQPKFTQVPPASHVERL